MCIRDREVDGEPLKEEGELTPRLGPRDRNLFHPMLGALDAGDLRLNPRPQLTGIFPEGFGTLLPMCLPTLIGGSAPATAAVKGA